MLLACVSAAAVGVSAMDAVNAKVFAGTTRTARTTPEPMATRGASLGVTCSDQRKDHCNDTAAANDEPVATDGGTAAPTDGGGGKTTEELRKRVEQLTNDLSKASASLENSKQREKQLIVLEKEKYKWDRQSYYMLLNI